MSKLKTLYLVLAISACFLLYGNRIYQPSNQLDITFNQNEYAAQWARIDSSLAEGLPESANKQLEVLYQRAKRENVPDQMVKTILYKANFAEQLNDENLPQAIMVFYDEYEKAQFPVKQILASVLAEQLNNYAQQNQWQFQNRTAISNDDNTDISTWSLDKIYNTAFALYHKSIDNADLKRIAITQFNSTASIKSASVNTLNLRPSLYDFLAFRALDFFSNEQSYITKPISTFYLDDEAAFADAAGFASHNFAVSDANDQKYQTLLLYQALTQYHLQDAKPDAQLDLDLNRLRFAYNNSVLGSKETLYETSLNSLLKKSGKNELSAEISYYLAQIYMQKAANYHASYIASVDSVNKYDYKTALQILDNAIQQFPNSYGTYLCKSALDQILTQNLGLTAEAVQIPGKPVLVKIDYRNLDKVWFRWLKVDENFFKSRIRQPQEDIHKALTQMTPIFSKQVNLPNDGDYQQHATEIDFPALEIGNYVLLASSSEKFTFQKDLIYYQQIKCSNLSVVLRNNMKNNAICVLERESGKAVADAEVKLFGNKYNPLTRNHEEKLIVELQTDKNGFAAIEKDVSQFNYISVKKGNDYITSNESYYYQGSYENFQPTALIFTDRSIYRPGQTVYYKLLAINYKNGVPEIMPNRKVTVSFYDVNGQLVESKNLLTNEYGTLNGTFIAPNSGITGQMYISSNINNSPTFISVEEYKRPQFEINFDDVTGSYKLGEKVTVSGKAMAYAGYGIANANVKYRVERSAYFPYWPWWRCGWFNPWSNASLQISMGETKTDENGKFVIDFTALDDNSIPKDRKPQYTYTVYADVVDITGETHSATSRVQVGTVSILVNAQVPDKVEQKDFDKINISSTNLNGVFEAFSGEMKVEKLKQPNEIYQERYWEVPDNALLSEAEFKRKFPYLPYRDENEANNWEVSAQVLTQNFTTQKDQAVELNKKNWEAGFYKLSIKGKDAFGEEVNTVNVFQLVNTQQNEVPANTLLANFSINKKYEPGQNAVIKFGSSFADAHILLEMLDVDGNLIENKWFDGNKMNQLQQSITEANRGNLNYQLSMVKNNRRYSVDGSILVPWSNKELQITYGTFRDKLQPGEVEKWQIKISGPKGEKVGAELLASMYDASLDQLKMHNWQQVYYQTNNHYLQNRAYSFAAIGAYALGYNRYRGEENEYKYKVYPELNTYNLYFYWGGYGGAYRGRVYKSVRGSMATNAVMYDAIAMEQPSTGAVAEDEMMEEKNVATTTNLNGRKDKNEVSQTNTWAGEKTTSPNEEPKVRTNLNETVFFYPDLHTDEDGNVILSFTMNEALTTWKFMAYAHTKDLQQAYSEKEIVTQKELMIQANAPRFFRQGDEIYFTAKISNLSDKNLSVLCNLSLFNALSMKAIDNEFTNNAQQQSLALASKQSKAVFWKIKVPRNFTDAVTYKITAKAENFSDGEQSSLPTLVNSILVTETLPMSLRGGQNKTFKLNSLLNNESNTLQNYKYTLEFTQNPAWYAVQAMPYLMEYPYECSEQIFNRYYANTLASHVANSYPAIQRVFESWKGTDAMKSNLNKNEELKSALLEETPWVLEAQSEEEQKGNIALLFDLNKMRNEQQSTLAKLEERQFGNGGFPWFPGAHYPDRYITQNIVEGMGHLRKLKVIDKLPDSRFESMMNKAISYCDGEMLNDYRELEKEVKKGNARWEDNHLSHMNIQYLYARTFFKDKKMDNQTEKAYNYYLAQAEKYWLGNGLYSEAMIALTLNRTGKSDKAKEMIRSFKERSMKSDEMGMYFKQNYGYNWYNLPTETQSLMIETFNEVTQDEEAVDAMKVWLLKNKQTNAWSTTKATANAIYALLMTGDNWLLDDKELSIKIAGKELDQSNIKKEAGTGYFKVAYNGSEVNNHWGEVSVSNPNKVVSWGAVYWQYFEDLDKVKTFKETPLTIDRKMFKKENTANGVRLSEIKDENQLKPGDRVTIRVELRVDRDMEYVHLKDMRAACFEPINVLSQYKYQDGLGYYESTRDVSTNFFFSYLPKGNYVFEYDLFTQYKGDFSNGISTIQCMYAPEFSSHSAGIRVKVE